jgi:hypothetical protein
MSRILRSIGLPGLATILVLGGLAAQAPAQVLQTLRTQTTVFKDNVADVKVKDVLEFLAVKHKLKAEVNKAAFRAANPDSPDVLDVQVNLPRLPSIRVSTVLQLVLDEAGATFIVKGDRIVIIPGETAILDESRTSPLTAKMRQPIKGFKAIDGEIKLGEVLDFFQERSQVPLIVYRRAFRAANPEAADIRETAIKGLKPDNAPLAVWLRQVLAAADATFVIRADHVLIVPRKPAPGGGDAAK